MDCPSPECSGGLPWYLGLRGLSLLPLPEGYLKPEMSFPSCCAGESFIDGWSMCLYGCEPGESRDLASPRGGEARGLVSLPPSLCSCLGDLRAGSTI